MPTRQHALRQSGRLGTGTSGATSQSTRSALVDLGARPPHALGLGLAVGLAQAGHVEEDHQLAAEIERDLPDVARGAGLVGDDGHVGLRQAH